MADIVGAGLGAAIGSAFGNPMLGLAIGQTLGSIYEYSQNRPTFSSGRLTDLKVAGASQAAPWPIVFGTVRVPGNTLWAPDKHESVSTSGGGGSLGGPRFENYAYTADFAVGVCMGEITRISKIWADSELVYDYNGGTPIWADWIDPDNVRVYVGSLSQTVDTLIDAERTAAGDEALAYIGRAYVVFEAWPWSRFGHDANLNFEVVRGVTPGLDDILTELFEAVGIDAAELDFTALSAVTVDGFMIPQRQELASAIEGLLRAYNADVVEIDGKLKGVLKDVASSFALDSKWLGVSTDGDVPATKIETNIKHELDLLKSVDVTYVSAAHDYQVFTQKAIALTAEGDGGRTLEMPLVLSEDRARHIAETILWEEREGRTVYLTTHTLHYLSVAPGDVGTVVVDGATVTVRVLDQVMGMFGHVETRLVRHESAVYTQYVDGATPPTAAAVTETGLYTIYIRDTPALRDADVYDDHVLVYAGASRASGWAGVSVIADFPYLDFNTGTYLDPIAIGFKAILGAADGVLASGTPGVWDRTNTIDVVLVTGTLSSASEANVLKGANTAVLGDEVIQFATATLIAANTYRLSNLLRGRRGTEWALGDHADGEPFAVVNAQLQPSHLRFEDMGEAADWVHYAYSAVAGSNVVTETLEGNSRKPYSPCDVAGSRDGSNNLTLTWTRRARRQATAPLGTPPLDEVSEAYEIDIMNGATVVRTLTSTSATVAYSAAAQTTDFGSPQSSLTVNVYQMAPGWGRGFARSATV